MNKKIWVYILTAVFFLSATLLGVTAVYRVDTVTVKASVVSDIAKAEADELQQRLYEEYNKDSIFFADAKEAKKILSQFPNFRLVSFKKSFPNRLIVSVKEATEVFAVPVVGDANRYYILGPEGKVLAVRDSYANSLDGESNILISGLLNVSEKNGRLEGDEYISSLMTFCQTATDMLGELRRNVASIEVLRMTSTMDETVFRINTREGVKIYVGYPRKLTEKKAMEAFEKYLSLSAEQRMKGRIAVSDKSGEIIISYAEKDDFAA